MGGKNYNIRLAIFSFLVFFVFVQESFSNSIPNFKFISSQVNITCSPTSIPSCSSQMVTFFISSDMSLPSSSLTYIWTIGPGWNQSGSVLTTTNYIFLTPSSPNSNLSAVSGKMVYTNNNGNQSFFQTDNCTVTRSPFTSNASISGSSNLCSANAIYSLSGLVAGQNVTWSLSNPTICSINSFSNTQVTLSPISNGSADLIATITNSCSQSIQKRFPVHVGVPIISSVICNPIGRDFCSGSPIPIQSNTLPILDLNDKVTASVNGMTPAEAALNTNWQWLTLNNKINLSGSLGQRRVGIISYGSTGVKVRAKNSCGWSDWYEIDFETYEVPQSLNKLTAVANEAFHVFPNPANDFLNVEIGDKSNDSPKKATYDFEVYDMMNVLKFKSKFFQDGIVDLRNFKKGVYVLKIISEGVVESHRIIVN